MVGMARHGGILRVGGTFFVFLDYMRPPVRLASLSRAKVVFVFSHDSGGRRRGRADPPARRAPRDAAGDPRTGGHRPATRTRPWPCGRPLSTTTGRPPSCSSRRGHPGAGTDGSAVAGWWCRRGRCGGTAQIVIVATGSEVALAMAVAENLGEVGVTVCVVSRRRGPVALQERTVPRLEPSSGCAGAVGRGGDDARSGAIRRRSASASTASARSAPGDVVPTSSVSTSTTSSSGTGLRVDRDAVAAWPHEPTCSASTRSPTRACGPTTSAAGLPDDVGRARAACATRADAGHVEPDDFEKAIEGAAEYDEQSGYSPSIALDHRGLLGDGPAGHRRCRRDPRAGVRRIWWRRRIRRASRSIRAWPMTGPAPRLAARVCTSVWPGAT